MPDTLKSSLRNSHSPAPPPHGVPPPARPRSVAPIGWLLCVKTLRRGAGRRSVVRRALAVYPRPPPPLLCVSAPLLPSEGPGDSRALGWQRSHQTSPPSFLSSWRLFSAGSRSGGGKWRRRHKASRRSRCWIVGPHHFPGSFSSPRLPSSCCRPLGQASAPRPAPAASLCWTAVAGNYQRRAGGRCRARCPPTLPACE